MNTDELVTIKQQNEQAIQNAIAIIAAEGNSINYETVSALLPPMLQAGSLKLNTTIFKSENPQREYNVGRYLVYAYDHDENPFSIWAFAFAVGQKTTIHDHEYRGTVTVLEGLITEKSYLPIDNQYAMHLVKENRRQFHTTRDDLDTVPPLAHQLEYSQELSNEAPETVITLHIYEMPAQHFDVECNVYTDNRNLSTIYRKAKDQESKQVLSETSA